MRSESVLISLKGYIGDAVMAIPLIEAVESQFGRVVIQTATVVEQVLKSQCHEREFLPLRRERSLRNVLSQAKELRGHGFSLALLVNHSFRSALVARLAGIPKIIGHSSEGRRLLLSHSLPYSEVEWEAWSYLDLLKPLGMPAAKVQPRICVSDEERLAGSSLLNGATVGIQPGARFGKKQLPIDISIDVAKRLQQKGKKIALLGGADEAKFSERVLAELPEPAIDLIGKTTVRQSLGAISALGVMIGSDTGLMHMAAAVGCPTITVFGPTPASKWGHTDPPHQVLLAHGGEMARTDPDELFQAAMRALESA